MTFKPLPEEGEIVLPPVSMEKLTNGQLLILTRATGYKFRQIRSYLGWVEDDITEEDPETGAVNLVAKGKGEYDGPVDEILLLWALGKLQLSVLGYDPSDENADRVRFEAAEDDESSAAAAAASPEPAVAEGPTGAQ